LNIAHAQLAGLANVTRSLRGAPSSATTSIEPYAVQTQAELIPQAFLRTKMIPEMEQILQQPVEEERINGRSADSAEQSLKPVSDVEMYDRHTAKCAQFLREELQSIRLNQRYRFEDDSMDSRTTAGLNADKIGFDEIRRSQEHLLHSLLRFKNSGTTLTR
jgi:hypothetical protein